MLSQVHFSTRLNNAFSVFFFYGSNGIIRARGFIAAIRTALWSNMHHSYSIGKSLLIVFLGLCGQWSQSEQLSQILCEQFQGTQITFVDSLRLDKPCPSFKANVTAALPPMQCASACGLLRCYAFTFDTGWCWNLIIMSTTIWMPQCNQCLYYFNLIEYVNILLFILNIHSYSLYYSFIVLFILCFKEIKKSVSTVHAAPISSILRVQIKVLTIKRLSYL